MMRDDSDLPNRSRDAVAELRSELRWLDRLLARRIALLREQGRLNADPMRGLFITEAEALAELGADEQAASPASLALRRRHDGRTRCGPQLALHALARRFGLDPIDRFILVMAAAPALERRYQTLFAFAQNDVARKWPSLDLALALLVTDPDARLRELGRFLPDAPLLRSRLIRWSDTDLAKPLADRPLTIDDRVVMALTGVTGGVDSRLAAFLNRAQTAAAFMPDETLVKSFETAAPSRLVVVEGPADAGQAEAAAAVCSERGLSLLTANLDHPGATALSADELGRLLAREALLENCGLLLSVRHSRPGTGLEDTVTTVARLAPATFVSARHGALDLPFIAESLPITLAEVEPPDTRSRADWWRAALPPDLAANAERLARRSRLGPSAIARVASESADEATLSDAIRVHAAGHLPALAERVETPWSWDDLVLPGRQRTQLCDLATSLVHGARVREQWGFAAGRHAPRSTIVLFCGPSGTGKSMAAGLVAAAATMPLYRVDLSAIFDKYIGETEKQLDRLFEAAEGASAVLLFDEADALFGKRTALKDAHDRYANISVAYLLQRIETYDGLAILATNLQGNIDEAFARRLAHIVSFPAPDEELRNQLWALAFPPEAPLANDIDLDALARGFELSGGNIRNAALAAAYLAAAENHQIHHRHLLAAIDRELEKIGRTPMMGDRRGAAATG